MSQQENKDMRQCFFRASSEEFNKVEGSPIAYWTSHNLKEVFRSSKPLRQMADIKQGLATCNNNLFLRSWFEVSVNKIGFNIKNLDDAYASRKKWFPYNKGGGFRKWYGNNEFLVNWENNGLEIHNYSNLPLDYLGAPVRAKNYYFKQGITYGLISSYGFSARRLFQGFIFDVGGSMIYPEIEPEIVLGLLCSKLTKNFLNVLNPTLNYQVGDIHRIPIALDNIKNISFDWNNIIIQYKKDWDSYESSWDFTSLPLTQLDLKKPTLQLSYQALRTHWQAQTTEMQRLEEENNRIFIEAYGLQDELTPDVPLNPPYS